MFFCKKIFNDKYNVEANKRAPAVTSSAILDLFEQRLESLPQSPK
jgi:hypothetical protein